MAVGQADALDALADIGHPVLGDKVHAAHDAHQRADRSAGAVGIVAAVDSVDHRLFEVAFAVKQAQYHIGHGRGRLEPAQVGAVFHDALTAFLPRYAVFVAVHHQTHAAYHAAVFRQFG